LIKNRLISQYALVKNIFFGGVSMSKNGNQIFVSAELGEKFRNARKKEKMSQLDLSAEVDVHNTIISKIEKGFYKANRNQLEKLCGFFGFNLDELTKRYAINTLLTDSLDVNLQLLAIEYDIDLLDQEQGVEQLRQLEEYSKYSGISENALTLFPYYLKGKYYEKKRKWNTALEQYGIVIQTINSSVEDIDEDNLKSACFNGMARVYLCLNELAEALIYANKGIDEFRPENKRHHIQYNLYINKAIILEKLNRDMEALALVEDVCEHGNLIRSDDAWLNLLLIRIELLNKLGRYDEAIHFALEGLFLARVDEMLDHAFDLWSSLGESYFQKGLMANAELCYTSALKLEDKIKWKPLAIKTHTHLGSIYCEIGKPKKGQKILEKAVKLAREYKDALQLAKSLNALSQCFVMQNQDLEAYKLLEEAKDLAKKYNFDKLMFDILLNMIDICKKQKLSDYPQIADEFQEISLYLVKGRLSVMKNRPISIKKELDSRPPND
jgi:tetratricopeptide (TPR) repeat protein